MVRSLHSDMVARNLVHFGIQRGNQVIEGVLVSTSKSFQKLGNRRTHGNYTTAFAGRAALQYAHLLEISWTQTFGFCFWNWSIFPPASESRFCTRKTSPQRFALKSSRCSNSIRMVIIP